MKKIIFASMLVLALGSSSNLFAQQVDCFPDDAPDAECTFLGRRYPVSQIEDVLIQNRAMEPLLSLVREEYGYKSFMPPASQIVEARYYEASQKGYFSVILNGQSEEQLYGRMTPELWQEFRLAKDHVKFFNERLKVAHRLF
jgi:hypothetical protein